MPPDEAAGTPAPNEAPPAMPRHAPRAGCSGTPPRNDERAAGRAGRHEDEHPAGRPGTHDPAPPHAGRVDADVPRAVQTRLEDLLARRVERACAVDETFGRDVAERLARFTLGAGRKIRPQFLWWGMRACGPPEGEQVAVALRLGAALELLQACALIHDDIMDGAATRRGRPSVHADLAAQYATGPAAGTTRFGDSAAILAGDLALVWADDEITALDLPPWQAERVHDAWAQMRMEMVAGQYLDIQGELTRTRSVGRAIRAACLKTALYTVERPLQLGALLGDADESLLRALCSAGRCTGLAFQLRDDLDDVSAQPRHRDKPAGADVRSGKPTYLAALAQARAEADRDRGALDVLHRCLGRPDLDDDGLDQVRDVFERTGATTSVQDKIDRLLAQAVRHLGTAAVDPSARDHLLRLMHAAAGAPPPAGPHSSAHRGAPARADRAGAVEGARS